MAEQERKFEPIRSGDPITAVCWTDEDDPAVFQGDDIEVHAELTDVDEVAILVRGPLMDEGSISDVAIYLPRVQAIALAGQIAWAATASQTELPWGHAND